MLSALCGLIAFVLSLVVLGFGVRGGSLGWTLLGALAVVLLGSLVLVDEYVHKDD